MDYRYLGGSGLKVSELGFGTVTFGGSDETARGFGATEVATATRLVDICLDAGINLFNSADIYSDGNAEEVLGKALGRRRESVLISTKATFRSGPGPNDVGSSRYHLTAAVEGSLRRLGTDRIDIFQLHGFDARTPVEETLGTLADLVRAGKIRYIGVSNFSGWHLMKSLAASDRYGWPRYVAHQAYYSLVGRSFEWELMPLAVDQKVGTIVWSPLGWARLTGRIRRNQPMPETSRLHTPEVFDRRAAARSRVRLPRGRRHRRRRRRDWKDRAADCAQLAAAAPHGVEHPGRRPYRGAAAPEPRRRRLGADARAGRPPRRRQPPDAGLSLLPPERLRAESLPGRDSDAAWKLTAAAYI